MEVFMNSASRSTTICQNENKLNVYFGPVMREILYYGLWSGSLNAISAGAWSKNKMMIHPTRIHANANPLTIIVKKMLE